MPLETPFAKALQLASHVLVIPNKSISIYTRLWCVYEAYLGLVFHAHECRCGQLVQGFFDPLRHGQINRSHFLMFVFALGLLVCLCEPFCFRFSVSFVA